MCLVGDAKWREWILALIEYLEDFNKRLAL